MRVLGARKKKGGRWSGVGGEIKRGGGGGFGCLGVGDGVKRIERGTIIRRIARGRERER